LGFMLKTFSPTNRAEWLTREATSQ
jgi:hypothetical protein